MTANNRISLDGTWDFQIDPTDGDDILSIKEWRAAQVPMPWQAQFDDLRNHTGTAWYRRRFEFDGDLAGKAAKETREFPTFPDYADDVLAAVDAAAVVVAGVVLLTL